jgi:hypothetical protein
MTVRYPRMIRISGSMSRPTVTETLRDSGGVFHISEHTYQAILDETLVGSEILKRSAMDEEGYKRDLRERKHS